MSYEFTKLGAVEALNEMPKNANALVEVDGAIKRVPASALGGSSTPAPVVILPETELREVNPGTQYEIPVPPYNAPTSGNTYKLTINGAEYNSPVVSYTAEGVIAYVFGNSDLMGVTDMLGSNPNPDAPFVGMVSSDNTANDGQPDTYGVLFVGEITVEAPVTLSIVEAAKTESAGGGGVIVVNVECDANEDMTEFTNATKDKTFEEIKAVYDAGGVVHCRLKYLSGPMAGMRLDWPIVANATIDGMEGFSFPQPMNMGATMITIRSNDSIMVLLD